VADPSNENGDWTQWRRLVLDKLETLESGQNEFRESIGAIKTDLAVQKVKAGMWGTVAGACTAALGYFADHWISGRR
jgi:hypothetical protein